MPYESYASRSNPMLFVFLLDQSGSMQNDDKAASIALAINHTINEIMFASQVGGKIIDRYYVGVLGYGASVYPILEGKISKIAANPLRIKHVEQKIHDGTGGLKSVIKDVPIWVEPRAENGTPMAEAFEKAYDLINSWIQVNPNSFPPIIVNVTDGEPNDVNRTKNAALRLMNLETSDGKVLLFNVHITGSRTSTETQLPFSLSEIPDQYAKFLFEISSIVPTRLLRQVEEIGLTSKVNSRGLIFNARHETFLKFLYVSTYPIYFVNSSAESNLKPVEHPKENYWDIPKEDSQKIQTSKQPSLPSIPSEPIMHSSGKLPEVSTSKHQKKFRVSISYPQQFSKRYSSLLLVQIYIPEMRTKVNQAVVSEFGQQKVTEHIKGSELKKGQTIRVKLSSPNIVFSDPVVKKLGYDINTLNFLAKPDDNCEPGIHKVLLSISNPDTQIEYQSINFSIRVTDFVFDHISRPFLSKIMSGVLGISSMLMFILTFLGQIDSTFGLTSGTIAGTLASAIYIQFFSLYKFGKTTTMP